MARGRKPNPRSQEEALQIRREQIRRNVRAFRDRKRGDDGKRNKEGSSELSAFVLERPEEKCLNKSSIAVARTQKTSSPSAPLVDEQPSDLKHHSSSALWTEDDTRAATLPATLADGLSVDHHPSSSALNIQTSTTSGISCDSHCTFLRETKVSGLLPPEINSAVLCRRQFVANSSMLFVPKKQGQPKENSDLGPHWAQNIHRMAVLSDILDEHLQPLCLLQIAHLQQDRDLLEASRYYYCQALQTLRTLSRSEDVLWKELFLSAMILGIYELFNGTVDRCTGWQCHWQGASSYLRRFTSFNESLTDSLYFHFLEAACIFDAIMQRKPSPLSTTKWWKRSIDCNAGGIYGQLLRVMTLLPGLLEQFDYLTGVPPNLETCTQKATLMNDCFLLEDWFKDWFEDTAGKVADFCYDDVGDFITLSDIPSPRSPDVQYSFPNLWIARLHLLYWSSIILLLEVMTDLVFDLSKKATHDPSSISPPWALDSSIMLGNVTTQANLFATNIRRSAAFCLRPCNGLVGKSIILQPLCVARNHLRQADEEQARWCTTVLGRLGHDS